MKLLYLLLLLSMPVYAQYARSSGQLVVRPQALAIDSYNSLGFSNISSCMISEISSANPASLNGFNDISTGLNFQYPSEIALFNDITLIYDKPWLPSSFGFVYPYRNFRFGLAYYQKYNSYIDFGEFEIRTIEQPDGTGEFYSITSERYIYSPSFIASYTINGVFNDSDRLSFGLQVFWNFLTINENIYNTEGRLKDNNISWKFGAIYEFKENTHIGLIYETGVDFEGVFEIEPKLITIVEIDNGSYVNVNPEYYLKLPDKFVLGITNQSLNNFLLSITVSSVFWKSVYDGYQNQLDISTAAVYKVSHSFKISLGFYNSDLISSGSNYQYANNVNFIGAGIKWNINPLDIQFEIMDSHLFSAESRKQTRVKLGLNYTFN